MVYTVTVHILLLRLMVYTVTEQGLTTARGSLKYDECIYRSGGRLFGSNGTWQAHSVDYNLADYLPTDYDPAYYYSEDYQRALNQMILDNGDYFFDYNQPDYHPDDNQTSKKWWILGT